ncbi:MAG TPA: glycosyl hydrolase family 28-related protein, partial [Humisphaera sp.]|nr:glycosyl hydrolase family 28-related protein [Humisphaera sp.]
VQGVRLRDGTWTANGPNVLHANALCSGMNVEFLERGPIETVVRVSYQFKGKPQILRNKQYPITSPGYPGGDGHYFCTIKILADQPSILFDEDSDVVTSWRMNLLPELNFDTARHPERQKDGHVKEVDFAVPYDADYGTSYLTQQKSIIHLMPWGWYGGEYYWTLFNSTGDAQSPVVGVFADKSGNSLYPDASGPGMVSSDNWMGSGHKGGGFNVQIARGTPDARTFPFVRLRWGLYVGIKGEALPPLGKPQPIIHQMDMLGGLVLELRNVTAKIPKLPRLNWEERSDWINVKTKVTPKAVGDGVADDTAALQAALDSLKSEGYANPNTIYLPPGVYRITRTLSWRKLYGKHIVGHGLDTRIVWDGDGTSPPVMFHSDGATAGVLFEGIVWDGAGKAEIGVNHCSSTAYESHVTHRNEAFINMKAGIVSSYSQYFKYKNATAEVLFDNCLFVNDDVGVAFGSYNALDNTVINCGFYYCGRGIFNNTGNVYVRRCDFVGSLDTDIVTNVGDSSAARCTSVGSKRFLHAGGSMFVLQDCRVDGWKSTKGAVERPVSNPLTIFDCAFTNPPDKQAPVQGSAGAAVLISNCKSDGTDGVLDAKLSEKAITIPPGKRGSVIASAQQRSFRSDANIPGKVFDARRDFGAKGDGKADDTDAIVATIKAAREHGKGAIAYLPNGQYRVSKTIDVFGNDYVIGGAGCGWSCATQVMWAGKRVEQSHEVAIFHIKNANNVVIEEFVAATPSPYYDDIGVISFLHTASESPSFVTYNDVGGFTQFRGLSQTDRVNIRMLDGIVDFDNCQRATILAEQIYPSRHPQSKRFNTTLRVRGKDQQLPKDGFLGIMTMFNAGNPYDIIVQDSQSLVISDYYTEQTQRVLWLEGNPGDTPGRFTLLAHKFHSFGADDLVQVRNYKGSLFLGASFLPQPPLVGSEKGKNIASSMTGAKQESKPFIFSQQGENHIDIMLVGCTYLTGEPILRKESGGNFILANDVVNDRRGPWHTDLSDEAKAKIAAALDHLRQLGQVDAEFKSRGR